jgi:hypothetical protein
LTGEAILAREQNNSCDGRHEKAPSERFPAVEKRRSCAALQMHRRASAPAFAVTENAKGMDFSQQKHSDEEKE